MFHVTKTAVLDMIERAIRTAVGAFFTFMAVSGWVPEDNSLAVLTNVSVLGKAGLSAAAAAISVVGAFILTWFGPKNGTTSVVPDVVDAEVIRALDPAGVHPPAHPEDV
jgi:hypothetical protein